MPILSRDRIVRIGEVMLEAGGALPGHASIVADHLAEANLARARFARSYEFRSTWRVSGKASWTPRPSLRWWGSAAASS